MYNNEEIAIESFISYCDNMMISCEAKMTKAERDSLPSSDFGLPSLRKYPLNDEAHIKDAITYFHFCKSPNRKELASNIVAKIQELKLGIKISPKSIILKYTEVPEELLNKADDGNDN